MSYPRQEYSDNPPPYNPGYPSAGPQGYPPPGPGPGYPPPQAAGYPPPGAMGYPPAPGVVYNQYAQGAPPPVHGYPGYAQGPPPPQMMHPCAQYNTQPQSVVVVPHGSAGQQTSGGDSKDLQCCLLGCLSALCICCMMND